MRGTSRLRFQGTVSTRCEASAYLKSPGDAVLIDRGRPRLLLLSCPCGCGEHFPTNLDPRVGPAWRLYGNRGFGLSLFPSVRRESGCLSHFVIWRDRIFIFGRNEDDLDTSPQAEETTQFIDDVRGRLPETELVSFSEIAQTLDVVPWDVLMVCRRLTRMGFAREGKGKQRGCFGRT
jgi:hypothetical protein